MILGSILLAIGLGLFGVGTARRADGTGLVPLNGFTFAFYPVTAVAFVASGAALMIANL